MQIAYMCKMCSYYACTMDAYKTYSYCLCSTCTILHVSEMCALAHNIQTSEQNAISGVATTVLDLFCIGSLAWAHSVNF